MPARPSELPRGLLLLRAPHLEWPDQGTGKGVPTRGSPLSGPRASRSVPVTLPCHFTQSGGNETRGQDHRSQFARGDVFL